ncbi:MULTISPECIES: ADP-ribosyltransferase [Bacteroidaceae]|uniref:ADP-ribosyltransferase n=1 Tax=Bacteroidaceae TaxID=815 RepID=UPI00356A54D3
MAKKKYIDYKKMQAELFNRTEGYAANVRIIYQQAFERIINLVKGTELEDGKPFSFADYGYSEEVTPILRDMYSRVYQVIRGGVEKEWLASNENNDALVKSVFGEQSIEDNHFARFFKRNKEAMDAFFARKSGDGGLNLSQKVWRYTGMFRDELENTLDLAIGEGVPANRLAAQIKKYLQDPDKFYRRFRIKVGEDENGQPIYGRKWKRRVWDKEANSYKWVDDSPKHFHPGRGVYRSSARNAQRLARTETNIAYRTADFERWAQLDFVVGIEIKLSNNHPVSDICDDLKGVYPKTFRWKGWHPNCRCYQVPVLAKQEELDEMLDKILDGDNPATVECEEKVKELPSQFTGWMQDNEQRIKDATEKGTLPYFLRDNEKVIYPPTAKEIAKARHEARTEAEANAIRQRWNVRKATYHYGNNMLRVMGGISDVDTMALAEALKHPDLSAIMLEAHKLKAIGKEIYSLGYIDSPMEVAKKFSLADAKAVNKAVADKLAQWDSLSLEQQLKKLNFEAYDFLGGNYHNVQQKYPTWQVSQQAYVKQIGIVQDKIDWKAIKDSYTDLSKFSTKSKPYQSLIAQLENAINGNDKAMAQQTIAELNARKESIEKAAAKRKSKVKDVKFKDSDFTQERKDAAKWFIHSSDANDYFFDNAVDMWKFASSNEKAAMYQYTAGSSYITEPLRAIKGYYHYYGSRLSEAEKHIADMTQYIARSTLKDDVWVKRDEISAFVNYRFGLSDLDAYISDPSKLVGKVGTDDSFMSCGNCRNTNFGSKPVCLNIYCPKGTQMTYAEPFSAFGSSHDNGDYCPGKKWNGTSKPTTTGENEIILQRGTKFRITKAEYTNGKWYIDMEVLEQSPKVIKEMVSTPMGFYCKY